MAGRETVFTIGHSTRPIEEFLELLRENGVRILADVRSITGSRHNPQFSQAPLEGALAQAGIRYVHVKKLGGRRGRQKEVDPSLDAAWTVDAFRNYADYAQTEPFREGIDELLALAREAPTAIMCAEAVWWRCHRRIVADHLLARGVAVRHILAAGKVEDATPTPFARFPGDGRVVYPVG